MIRKKFEGPLFIIGLSRSGTKLIRDLLNKNNSILIPKIESHFIPKLLSQNNLNIDQLQNKIQRTSFVIRYSNIKWPDILELEEFCKIDSKEKFIEALLKYYALEGKQKYWNDDMIWGDKTPSYLRSMDLLECVYPKCKFIHIIRDPRDRALSVKKTWGKSMYRATELWRIEIQESLKWKNKPQSYIELKYEDLILNTEKVLREICEFLEIDFSNEMLQLDRPAEKYGNTSKTNKVSKTSISKFEFENSKVIKRIEEIAYPLMDELGYKPKYARKFRPFSPFLMNLFKLTDFISFKYNNKIKGF